MKYLHTMVRVTDLEQSLAFYCDCLGMLPVDRRDYEEGRFTICMLAARGDESRAKAEQKPRIRRCWS